MPPKQRSKSRYFNLDELVNWGMNIINYLEKEKWKLREKKEQEKHRAKLELKLGWVFEYFESLRIWKEMILMTRRIEEKVKKEGIHQEFWRKYEQKDQKKLKSERINNFQKKIEESLKKEIERLKEEEVKIMSTDVIESLFGKYKSFSEKSTLKEIRRMILTIPLSTLEINRKFIKQALEKVKNVDIQDWEEKTFGQSMLSKRKIAFNC